jgi:prepilin-type N-terminal cleavage/methylation domain-containing protein
MKRTRYRGNDEGVTLLELIVVALVLGVLMALAVPTFLGLTAGAKQIVAESDLQNALVVAKNLRAADGNWPGGDTTPVPDTPAMAQYTADDPNAAWISVENVGSILGAPPSQTGGYSATNYSYGNQIPNEIFVNVWVPAGACVTTFCDSIVLSTQGGNGRCYMLEDLATNQSTTFEEGFSVQAGPLCSKPPVPYSATAGSATANLVPGTGNPASPNAASYGGPAWATWWSTW